MALRIDLTGQVFERLTVLKFAGKNRHGQALWEVLCSCGVQKTAQGACLRNGSSKSCGCLRLERARKMGHANKTHGATHTGAYGSWRAMMRRCYETTHKDFQYWGAKGITVCDRWHSSSNFLADMGERPPGHQIDRISNTGNYEPSNCRWVTSSENVGNRRNTLHVTIGKVTRTLKAWCDISGVAYPTARMRIERGWSPKEIVFGRK